MNRSTNIKSRVFRNLQNLGRKNSDVVDDEIYDAIQRGQDRIISDVFPDRIVTITLTTGIDSYPLSTSSAAPYKKNIASVKIIETPDGMSKITVTTERRFSEIVKNKASGAGSPFVATVINSNLHIYPIPIAANNGKQIKLYVYSSASAGVIDKDNEPELPEYFDYALELFATYQFLVGTDRQQFLREFEGEAMRLRPIPTREHHNLYRDKVTGW